MTIDAQSGGTRMYPWQRVTRDFSHPELAGFNALIPAGTRVHAVSSEWYRDASADANDPQNTTWKNFQTSRGDTMRWEGGGLTYEDRGRILGPIAIQWFTAPADQPLVPVVPAVYQTESDVVYAPFPLTPAVLQGYPSPSQDSHVIVYQPSLNRLYEAWSCKFRGDHWACSNLAVYDTTLGDAQRPWNWTGSDVAGCALLPGTIRAEELAAGDDGINHAIRLTMVNVQNQIFRLPATHGRGGAGSSWPVLGARAILRSSFPETTNPVTGQPFSPAARAIIRALKRYGGIIPDGGTQLALAGAYIPGINHNALDQELRTIVAADLDWKVAPGGLDYTPGTVPTGTLPTASVSAITQIVALGSPASITLTGAGTRLNAGNFGIVNTGAVVAPQPARDTTYQLQAINSFGQVSRFARVLVTGGARRYSTYDMYWSPAGAGDRTGRDAANARPFSDWFTFVGEFGDDIRNRQFAGLVHGFVDGVYDLTPYIDYVGSSLVPGTNAGATRSVIFYPPGGLPGKPTVLQALNSRGAQFLMPASSRRAAIGAFGGASHVELFGLRVTGGKWCGIYFEAFAQTDAVAGGLIIDDCQVDGQAYDAGSPADPYPIAIRNYVAPTVRQCRAQSITSSSGTPEAWRVQGTDHARFDGNTTGAGVTNAVSELLATNTVVVGGGGGSLLFDANYSTDSLGASELTEGESGGFSTQGRIAAGGPTGQDAFQCAQTPGANPRDFGGQYGWGHGIGLAAWPANTSRFVRMRLRMDAANNFRGRSWADGTDARSVNKFIHVGTAPGRWIQNIEGESFGGTTWGWSLQIDGGAQKVERFGLARGVWYDVQLEMRYGTGAYAKLWIDDMTYATPWLQTAVFNQAPPADSGALGVGYFNNNGLRADGIFTFRHADLEVGTAFDGGW